MSCMKVRAMSDTQTTSSIHVAALVERAYRMSLVLKTRALCDQSDIGASCPVDFERLALCLELVDLLDETRCALLKPTPVRRG